MLINSCNLVKPLFCTASISVVDVASRLKRNKQRRIIVVDTRKAPLGIISTTDINNKVVAENKNAAQVQAGDIMTSPIFLTCDVNDRVVDVFRKMIKHETFYCPVTDKGKLIGVLTYGELFRSVRWHA